jgi:hypothetical protein
LYPLIWSDALAYWDWSSKGFRSDLAEPDGRLDAVEMG